jgi:hypothetical protein
MATLTIRDETATGRTTGELTLDVLDETISVRELIRSRVYQEVQDHNRRKDAAAPFNGLVTPRDEERMLNAVGRTAADAKASPGAATPRHLREIDWKKQFDVACDAFQRNGFFILVDDKQAESLDEQLALRHDTRVSFVKLTPLVGG